ncbi:MAG: hypothetical protein CEO22_367 [Candidatus Berkelbacteria bacterium Gr01-1014_85]|uniref:Uncharacterized protein n=1 Tax=Candidatus Berkelbacteria bacterium Gr01-1014_85 TaxID=2017150 RepID=A0A554JBL7_9BACT|nr:MAG: hypothetical protein CEO22_367 [Candidatus Berkelbacteria bacterium Gr01-1014_85]
MNERMLPEEVKLYAESEARIKALEEKRQRLVEAGELESSSITEAEALQLISDNQVLYRELLGRRALIITREQITIASRLSIHLGSIAFMPSNWQELFLSIGEASGSIYPFQDDYTIIFPGDLATAADTELAIYLNLAYPNRDNKDDFPELIELLKDCPFEGETRLREIMLEAVLKNKIGPNSTN